MYWMSYDGRALEETKELSFLSLLGVIPGMMYGRADVVCVDACLGVGTA